MTFAQAKVREALLSIGVTDDRMAYTDVDGYELKSTIIIDKQVGLEHAGRDAIIYMTVPIGMGTMRQFNNMDETLFALIPLLDPESK